jgi:hypothetical protein
MTTKHRAWIGGLTGVLFIVVGLSGVAMLLHLRNPVLNTAHEWAGLAFALAAVGHLLLNWRPMLNHLRTRQGSIAALSAVAFCALLLLAGAIAPDGPGHERHGRRGANTPQLQMGQVHAIED